MAPQEYKHVCTFKKEFSVDEYYTFKHGERIWCGPHLCDSYPHIKFHLKIFPHGEDLDSHASFFVYCRTDKGLSINYTLSVVDFEGHLTESTYTADFTADHRAWGKKKLLQIPARPTTDEEEKVIKFSCTVRFNVPDDFLIPSIPQPQSLKEKIMEMFTKKTDCDVKLVTKDYVREAHKFVLSIRSDVFRSMISSLLVKDEDEIDIPFDQRVVDVCIDYLYTDELPELRVAELKEIYTFSDTYQLSDLKSAVLIKLEAAICATNAVDLANFAHQIGNERLRYYSGVCIKNNLKLVQEIESLNDSLDSLHLDNCKYVLKML